MCVKYNIRLWSYDIVEEVLTRGRLPHIEVHIPRRLLIQNSSHATDPTPVPGNVDYRSAKPSEENTLILL